MAQLDKQLRESKQVSVMQGGRSGARPVSAPHNVGPAEAENYHTYYLFESPYIGKDFPKQERQAAINKVLENHALTKQ